MIVIGSGRAPARQISAVRSRCHSRSDVGREQQADRDEERDADAARRRRRTAPTSQTSSSRPAMPAGMRRFSVDLAVVVVLELREAEDGLAARARARARVAARTERQQRAAGVRGRCPSSCAAGRLAAAEMRAPPHRGSLGRRRGQPRRDGRIDGGRALVHRVAACADAARHRVVPVLDGNAHAITPVQRMTP